MADALEDVSKEGLAPGLESSEAGPHNIDIKSIADNVVTNMFGKDHGESPAERRPLSRKTIESGMDSGVLWESLGVQRPENADFFNRFHNEVLAEGLQLQEDTGVTTMRITSMDIDGFTYLLPLYDPTDQRVLDPKDPEDKEQLEVLAEELRKAGEITPYNSVEEAERDLDKFYERIIERTDQGKIPVRESGEVYTFNEGGAVPEPDPLEFKIANLLGVPSEDLRWAEQLGKKYGQEEEWLGKGDAARHLAVGWLANKAKNPKVFRDLLNAREYLTIGNWADRRMDVDNNFMGFGIKAESREEAEEVIDSLIKDKMAVFMEKGERQDIEGYEEGGEVKDTSPMEKIEPGLYQDQKGRLFKVDTDGEVQYIEMGTSDAN